MADCRAICRLLPLQARDGALNMAIDEALLLSAEAGRSAPTLRLYAWSRPTLSLGYFQDAPRKSGDSIGRLAPRGDRTPGMLSPDFLNLPTVRRLTGGGAIAHAAELTYSLTWRTDGAPCGIPGGVGASYAHFNQALAAALGRFGLEAGAPADKGSPRALLCFERRSPYDLMVDGHKIVGSAQRRRRGAVLQHGSILVGASPARGVAFRSISELLRREVPLAEMAEAVALGFEQALGWRLEAAHLSIDEAHLAEGLRHHVYSHLAWGGRRRGRADAPQE